MKYFFYWKYFSISFKINILATQIEDFEVGDQLLIICNLDREGPIVLFLFISEFEVTRIDIVLLMVLLTFINLTQLQLLENKIVLK